MAAVLASLLLLLVEPSRVEFTVDPRPGSAFELTFSGPSSVGSGDFRGKLALYGSHDEMPFAGKAVASGGAVSVTASLRYADVPADWLARFRTDSFDYALLGEVAGGGAVSWSGTAQWADAAVAGNDLRSRFLKLGSLEMTALSASHTGGLAVLNIENPFSFPVTVAAASCRVSINGQEIGGGAGAGRVVRGKRTIGFELPFASEEKAFLAAAGDRWARGASAGMSLDAGLTGTLTLHLPAGDVAVPLRFSQKMGTNGIRSGVFGHVPSATSMSPR